MTDNSGGKVVLEDVRGVVTEKNASQLQERGVKPEDVSHISFSHAHFTHIGNSRYFTNAKWYV